MTHLSMDALVSLREAGQEPGDAAAREHLESCEHCRAELERLHQRVARLKALPALRSGRDRWPAVRARVMAERRHRRTRMAGLVGLAAAASIALAVAIGPTPGPVGGSNADEIQQAMDRSQALESALHRYDPESRVLDGRTARIAQELEDRIAQVDRELEVADLMEQQAREPQVLRLWRGRVGLLDALMDVHVTRASNAGLCAQEDRPMRPTPLLITMLAAGGLPGPPAAPMAKDDGPGLGVVQMDRAHDGLMRIVMNRRARLGIKMNLQARATDSIGAYVDAVTPGGPAAQAGIRSGDLITK